jgi:hypothetical protein
MTAKPKKQIGCYCTRCQKHFDYFVNTEEFSPGPWETKYATCTHCGKTIYLSWFLWHLGIPEDLFRKYENIT